MKQNQRVALITGAGSGIGRAIALELSNHGYYIIITCRSQSSASSALSQIQASGGAGEFIRCDISDLTQIDSLMEHIVQTHGHLEVLVNNAAISNTRTMDEIDESEWDQMLATNLKGPFFYAVTHFISCSLSTMVELLICPQLPENAGHSIPVFIMPPQKAGCSRSPNRLPSAALHMASPSTPCLQARRIRRCPAQKGSLRTISRLDALQHQKKWRMPSVFSPPNKLPI